MRWRYSAFVDTRPRAAEMALTLWIALLLATCGAGDARENAIGLSDGGTAATGNLFLGLSPSWPRAPFLPSAAAVLAAVDAATGPPFPLELGEELWRGEPGSGKAVFAVTLRLGNATAATRLPLALKVVRDDPLPWRRLQRALAPVRRRLRARAHNPTASY